ncbi:hypothetical protein CDAR_109951 [Caerostris darwini]|uniref:Uncharacterized protein n=1 Tax=Caerostris darwini TaxID=1538125 RepID=A0AAV4P223_9ARAC|nr:hypothetical protein CDAR_109951 [Caerostris darwini]
MTIHCLPLPPPTNRASPKATVRIPSRVTPWLPGMVFCGYYKILWETEIGTGICTGIYANLNVKMRANQSDASD